MKEADDGVELEGYDEGKADLLITWK